MQRQQYLISKYIKLILFHHHHLHLRKKVDKIQKCIYYDLLKIIIKREKNCLGHEYA